MADVPADADAVPHPAIRGELLLETREFLAKDVLARRDHAEQRFVDLRLDRPILPLEIDERQIQLGIGNGHLPTLAQRDDRSKHTGLRGFGGDEQGSRPPRSRVRRHA